MNVIILAGGYAKRLWPLTEQFPKALLRIAGKPVLYYLMENIKRIPDITSITIAIDERNFKYFKDNEDEYNIISKVVITRSIHSDNPDGTIKGPLEKISEIIDDPEKWHLSGDNYLVLGADNVFGFDLERFCSFYGEKKKSCNATQVKVKPFIAEEFGIPSLDSSGKFKDFQEKPGGKVRVISTACYLFKRHDIFLVKNYLNEKNEDSLGLFIKWLIKHTEIIGYRFNEEWFDIGTRKGILDANKFVIKEQVEKQKWGKNVIVNDCSIDSNVYFGDQVVMEKDSSVGPYVYIEKNARISKSNIGPDVYIGADTIIENSKIENAIIYGGCMVRNCVIVDSVVGSLSSIEGKISEAVFGSQSIIEKTN
jgi:glucose-1-phosphate thymidylyltransferase